MKTHTAFIALGSNMENPEANILQAFFDLGALPGTQLLARSSLYRSAPVDCDDPAEFINAVAKLATELSPSELMQALLEIEHRHGRRRRFRNQPRPLDLDLLSYDEIHLNQPGLTLPHPRMHERAFVLLPLSEIAPDYRLGGHARIEECLKNCGEQAISRLSHAAQ